MTFLLNPSQIHALENRLLNQRELPGAVWGPPGTGKTTTASFEATDAIVKYNERVLITAYQNSTVDMTLRYIIQLLKIRFGMKDNDIIKKVKRTGTLSKVAQEILPYYTINHHDLSEARIVGVTLHSSYVPTGHQILDPNSFDRILMDESGQVTPEQAWIPLRPIGNNCNSTITAYGDDIQLTPISPDFIPDWSILRYLRNKNANTVNMLNITQRLNWPGVKMTSSIFYNNNLSAPQEVRDRRLNIVDSPIGQFRKAILPENTLAYVGVKGNEKEDGLSFDNYEQAKIIYDICKELLRVEVQAENVSVIASYRPHVKTITSILEGLNIRCSTVHRMLGGENDVIIFATTRSNYMRDLGFTSQAELLNVATSRHLRKLIIVGDVNNTFAEGCSISSKIYDFISTHGTMIIA